MTIVRVFAVDFEASSRDSVSPIGVSTPVRIGKLLQSSPWLSYKRRIRLITTSQCYVFETMYSCPSYLRHGFCKQNNDQPMNMYVLAVQSMQSMRNGTS